MKKILSLMMLLMAFTVNGFAQDTWTVAGSSTVLFGTAWDPSNTANDMVLDGSIYKWEKSGVALTTGTVAFKVVKDHSWDEAYPDENYELAIPWDDTYNVSITFDSSTGTVHAIAVAKVEIRGGFTNWDEGSPVTLTQDGGVNTYKGVLDLSAYTKNQKMKLIYNGEWLGYNQLTIDAPSGWTYDDETVNHNITLKNGYSGYQTYDLTASWSHSGWTLTIAGKAADTRAESTYTLVGAFFNADWSSEIAATPFGTKWTILDDNQLAKGAGTTYTKTYSNVDFTQEGHVQCKMLKDEDWDTYLEATVDIPAAGRYNIVYTYDKSAQTLTGVATEVPKTITAVELLGSSNDWASALATFTADGVTGYWTANSVNFAANDKFKVRVSYNYGDPMWLCPESIGDFVVNELQLNKELTLVSGGSNNMTVNHAMPLNFSMNPAFTKLTITCDDVYNLIGEEALTGYDWDKTKNEMAINSETGLYEWTANNILVTETVNPQFKVVKNGSTYYPDGGSETNWVITLGALSATEAAKYNIKITFNAETDVIGVTGEKSREIITIGEAGWATTVTSSALNFEGSGITAYTATLAGTTVTLNPVENVQAGTAIVLKGAEDTYYVPVIASSETAKGDLKSSNGSYVVNDTYMKCFGLAVKDASTVRFAKIKNGTTIPVKKAFLEVDPGVSAQELNVTFDDESGDVTGIQTLNAERNTLNGETYNLAGQKVNKSYKGLVISNGRKVIVK